MPTAPVALGGSRHVPVSAEEKRMWRKLIRMPGVSYRSIAKAYGRHHSVVARALDAKQRRKNVDANWYRRLVEHHADTLDGLKLFRLAHKRAGLCRDCNAKVVPGRASCQIHLDKQKALAAASRARRRNSLGD